MFGIDGATFRIIKPYLYALPTFKFLLNRFPHKELVAEEFAQSAPAWTTIFSGLSLEEHGHLDFVYPPGSPEGRLLKREDINATFIWEKLNDLGFSTGAMNIPVVVPPLSFNCNYIPYKGSLVTDKDEAMVELLQQKNVTMGHFLGGHRPDFFSMVVTTLDRVQHFAWNDRKLVLSFYNIVDSFLNEFLRTVSDHADVLILSDHGFNSAAEANSPQNYKLLSKTNKVKLQGDHDKEGILIGVGVDIDRIHRQRDVYSTLMERYGTLDDQKPAVSDL